MLSFTSVMALAAIAQSPASQAPSSPAFSSKLHTLVVFKEGFGFYVREGAAKLENGWATTNLVPNAVSGSFWVYPKNPEDRVDTIILTRDNRVEFEKPEALKSELANKEGLNLRITTEGRTVNGKLTNLLDKMLLVQDPEKNYVAIEYAKIESVALTDYPVRVKLKTAKPNAAAGIGIAYIQEGVRWQPTYTLELNGKQGRLTLRGTLLNLDEPLKDANVVFVVGAPMLANRGVLDDLLQGYLAMPQIPGAPGGFGGGGLGGPAQRAEGLRQGNNLSSNAPVFKTADPTDSSFVVSTDETGELQYYTKPGFTMRPGEKAMTSIFEVEIPVTSLFNWDANGDTVQYILTLENKSSQPFTTGPVFVIENQRPVGQQLIMYTPPGSRGELRLAQGIGLKTERREEEIKRGDPFKIGQENWLPITVQGKLTMENFRKEAADVRINKTLVGKILDLGANSKVKSVEVAKNGPNTISQVEWRVQVPVGKKVEVAYTYETYSAMGR